MELSELKALLLVSRKGTLTQAANLLRMTPAGVSLRLKRLEEELGVRLFERRSNKLLLTDRGRIFAGQIARCLDDLSTAVTDIPSDTRHVPKDISVAISGYMLPCLDKHFADFAKSNPHIKLTLLPRSSAEIIDLIVDDRVEFGIGWFPSVPRSLARVPLLSSSLLAVYPKRGAVSDQKDLSIQQFASQPLVMWPQHSSMRRAIDEVFAKNELDINISMEVGSCSAIKQFVKLGLGIGIVHDICFSREELSDFRIKDLKNLFGRCEVVLLHKASRNLSLTHKKLMASIFLAITAWKRKRRSLF